MPLDPNIFFQGAALRQANDARTQQLIGGLFDKLEARRMAEQDPERMLRASVARVVQGQGTPEDEKLIKFESILKGGETKYMPDEFGNVRAVSQPTLYDRLYGAGTQPMTVYEQGGQGGGIPPVDMASLEGPTSIMDKIPLPPMGGQYTGDNFEGGEPGIDLQRIADAKARNAAAVFQPAGGLSTPNETTRIDATPYGQKERYKADVDLQKKRLEKQIDIEAKAQEPLTLEQGKVATFADRMAEANKTIGELTNVQTDLKQKTLSQSPVLPNYMTSSEYKRASQAQRNFINAVLRRESGAVISPEEFENAKQQYFPQPGDTEEVIKQKAQNRNTVIEGFSREAGPSYKSKNISQKPTPEKIRAELARRRGGQ